MDAGRNGLANETLAWMRERGGGEEKGNQVRWLGKGSGDIHPAHLSLSPPPLSHLSSLDSPSLDQDGSRSRLSEESLDSTHHDRSSYLRSSSALSQHPPSMISSQAMEDGFVEELREESKARISSFSDLEPRMIPCRSPSMSSSGYPSHRLSTHSQDSPSHLEPQPETRCLGSRTSESDSISLHSSTSALGPLTPHSDLFSPSSFISPHPPSKAHSPFTPSKDELSTLLTRPSLDSLRIQIPGSSLGLSY